MARVGVGKRNAAIMRGEEDVTMWSDEELIRGQRRDRNGKWGGRPPTVIPAVIHHELVKRRMGEAGRLLNESLVDAVLLLRQVVTDNDADYSDRIKAANIVLERVMGKAPVQVNVTHEPPWAIALQNALINVEDISIVSAEHQLLEAASRESGDDDE